jgi:hypothetical protein
MHECLNVVALVLVFLTVSAMGTLLMFAAAAGATHRGTFAVFGGVLGLLAAPYIWLAAALPSMLHDIWTHERVFGATTAGFRIEPLTAVRSNGHAIEDAASRK